MSTAELTTEEASALFQIILKIDVESDRPLADILRDVAITAYRDGITEGRERAAKVCERLASATPWPECRPYEFAAAEIRKP